MTQNIVENNFTSVSTTNTDDEESDIETEADIQLINITESSKNNQKSKLILVALVSCIVLFVIATVICIVFFIETSGPPQANQNRPKQSIEKCANLHCCRSRSVGNNMPLYDNNDPHNENKNNIDCTALNIEECTSYDAICVWNCNLFPNIHYKRKFMRFDPAIGSIRAQREIFDAANWTDSAEPSTVQEILIQSKFIQYTECGDVYEVELDEEVAEQILNDTRLYRTISDSNHSNIVDIDDERRRLTIFDPDERWQSTIKNSHPTQVVGQLFSDAGSCTATLISRRVLLTAAHCLYDEETDSWVSSEWRFYPDAASAADITSSNRYTGYEAMVPSEWAAFSSCTTALCRNYDWGLVRLSTSDTGLGYLGWGYDNTLTAPLYFNTIGYPGDKPLATRWKQYCPMTHVFTQQFWSNDCDLYKGQSGSCIYSYKTDGSRTCYGVASAGGDTINVYCRIDSIKFNKICDFIAEGEAAICSDVSM